ncbi:hypothetical protein QUF65_16200 [Lysinibacillus sphaericus]|uniref:hypothetical protein n=1 Tax=Lysinibacillus sphaericus TaxID=1421 RepID=UPI0025A1938C|nr:hypothetical protein [Lysinibacillus sphaericus]MDM5352387.1 hypothetical protein [Lysinibacillus sphaericus]
MKTFIEESKTLLNQRRPNLEKIKTDIENVLTDVYISSGKNHLIQSRVKGPDSLAEKIIRKNSFSKYNGDYEKYINDLDDVIGIRIVCVLQKEEFEFHELLKNSFLVVSDKKERKKLEKENKLIGELHSETGILFINFSNQPEIQKNNHKIFKYKCVWEYKNEEGVSEAVNVELQIKSLIHMFWGEIEHMIMYKNYGYLIDKSFYKNIMDSTFKLLEGIDEQLLAMSLHLNRGKNDEKLKLVESREMFSKLLFNSSHTAIEKSLESKIDLREIYEALTLILTTSADTSLDVLKKLENYLESAVNYNVTFEELIENERFEVNHRNSKFEQANGTAKLALKINDIVRESDLFWRLFIDILIFLLNKDEQKNRQDQYTETLLTICENIYELYKPIYNGFSDEKYRFFNNVVFKSLDITLSYCPKLMFIYKQESLVGYFARITSELINKKEETIPIKYDNECYQKYISYYVSGHFLTFLNYTLGIDDLNELLVLHKSQISGFGEFINIDELEDIINDNNSVNSEMMMKIFPKLENIEEIEIGE